jgi:hypothetical protein
LLISAFERLRRMSTQESLHARPTRANSMTPYVALAQRRYDPLRVVHADCPCLSDQGCHRRLNVGLIEPARQKALDHRDLLNLPLHQVVALALFKKARSIRVVA